MDPYRVLLVDDEEDIRVGISRKMPWAELGFELIGEAENGSDALELAEQLRPDVVLTDIKMPFMDGLELCRLLCQRLPAAKFVIFSGFDDFEYAKQAIRLNVSEYILKPINAAELSLVLERIRKQLDEERVQRRDAEMLKKRYEESLPLLRESFLARLLEGNISRQELDERAIGLDVCLDGASYVVALTHFDAPPSEKELTSLSVKQLLSDSLNSELFSFRVFFFRDSVAILAAFPFQNAPMYAFIEEMNRVCMLARSYLGIRLTIGIGTPRSSAVELAQSADGALSALGYRVLAGTGRAIYIGDVEPNAQTSLSFDETDERELSDAVKLGSEDDIRLAVESIVNKLRRTNLALAQCQLFFLELLTCLLTLARKANIEPEEVFGEDFLGSLKISDFNSTEDFGNWCQERCLRIRTLIGRQRTDSAWRTVEQAKSFISANYARYDLAVELLCDHLHLSPAYFSTLFKRETGMSFTAYVTSVRMEKASELLKTTDEKTYRIAELIGFSDPNYFSYVFKKYYGMTPTKFRGN
ncbi:MAG: response regulator [Clostridia bacterium]|nr:response regulator [Clostridia bacterium]